MLRRFIGRKLGIAVLVAALATLAVGVSIGVAKSGPSQINVGIQYHNALCGTPTTKKYIAKANVIAEKGKLTVRGKTHGADPGKYELQVFDADCNYIATIDRFGVDSHGDGNFAGSTTAAAGMQSLFISIWNVDIFQHNDSVIFKIGGL